MLSLQGAQVWFLVLGPRFCMAQGYGKNKQTNKQKKLDTEQWVNILIFQVGTRKMEKEGKERQEEQGKVWWRVAVQTNRFLRIFLASGGVFLASGGTFLALCRLRSCGSWALLPPGVWDLSSQTKDGTGGFCTAGQFLTIRPPRKPQLGSFYSYTWTVSSMDHCTILSEQ